MAEYGRPTAPNPSPAIATGLYADPANRGVDLQTLSGRLPHFTSWDEAIRSPALAGMSDVEKTQYLYSTYGLSQEWKVENGQLVRSDPWLARNAWWLAPTALVGGSALGAALGGAGTATPAAATSGVLPSSDFTALTPLGGIQAAPATSAANALASPAASAGAAAGGIGGSILHALTSKAGIGALASLAPLLAGGAGGGGRNPIQDFNAQYPQLNELLTMSANRASRTDPLHQAVTQLAMSRLPTSVQR